MFVFESAWSRVKTATSFRRAAASWVSLVISAVVVEKERVRGPLALGAQKRGRHCAAKFGEKVVTTGMPDRVALCSSLYSRRYLAHKLFRH